MDLTIMTIKEIHSAIDLLECTDGCGCDCDGTFTEKDVQLDELYRELKVRDE